MTAINHIILPAGEDFYQKGGLLDHLKYYYLG